MPGSLARWVRRCGRAIALLSVALIAAAAPAQLTCTTLRCERLVDPLGVQEARPRLSWVTESEQRGQRQTAYRLLVASAPERLAADEGDLWDSGRIESVDAAHIEYSGPPLASRQSCFWKVMAWDAGGIPGPWSPPARFEIALLSPADWSAQWIDAGPRSVPVEIIQATYYTADGSVRADVTDRVSALVGAGEAVMASNDALGGDPAVNVPKRLEVHYRSQGRAQIADVAENRTVTFAGPGLPLLRRTFDLPDSPVVRARLYATALGVYEVHLNGRRVGDLHLAPGWTDYRRRLHYQVYDVTDLVKTGPNALASVVAPGWFSGRVGLFHISRFYGARPAFLAQLEITHADGSTTVVGTDAGWRRHDGPTLLADMMDGESHDARLEIPGWIAPGFDDSTWEPVEMRAEARTLEATPDHPVRVLAELPARFLSEPAPGRWTFDLGQNMVGVVRLAVRAPAGTALTIRHAEILNPDGTIYTANLRGAAATDTYICRGPNPGDPGAPEVWQPAFTFHGFRYIEVTGFPSDRAPAAGMVTGIVLGSDLPPRGSFECSDPGLNQLQSNILWGLRGNCLSVPTDCPQRDERMGWTADTQVFAPTALFNTEAGLFLGKWLTDLRDAQRDDGAYPDVAPDTRGLTAGVPGWADAGCVVPWAIYQMDGDVRVLERHAESMIRWVEWCREHSTGLIRDRDRGNDYGDWLAIGAATPKDLIGTAYFARSTDLLARTLRVLGRDEQAAEYERLYAQIRAAFIGRYVDDSGHIAGRTQTGYLLALHFGLLPEHLRETAVEHLVADIRARGDRLSTGFLGVGLLLPVLSAAGRDDVAADLLMQDEFPSWLFSVRHGATTIWERWDGWTPATGPHPDHSMNSFNHYALGACGEWLYSGVVGIRPDPAHPGFGHIHVKPVLVPTLSWAAARIDTVRGMVSTRWSLDGGMLRMRVTIPVGASATVHLPTSDADGALESGRPIAGAPGVAGVHEVEGGLAVSVGSGTYEFAAPAPLSAPTADSGRALNGQVAPRVGDDSWRDLAIPLWARVRVRHGWGEEVAMGIWTLGVAVACVSVGAPPSVEEIERLAEEYKAAATPQRWNPERDGSPQEYLARIAADTLARVGDPSEFGLEHFDPLLETNLFLYAEDSSAFLHRLLVLAQDESVAGARAALNSFALAGHAAKERQADALDTAFEHPSIAEALREPGAWSHLTSVWFMFPADLGKERAERITEVLAVDNVPGEPTLWDVMGGVRFFDWMRAGDPEAYEQREPLRLALIELVERARGQVRDDDPQFERLSLGGLTPTQYLEGQIAYLTGPEATGTLVGAAAPDLEFAWRSNEALPSALSGLRGKVVVLDFFETWCGPCIASFPDVRELVEQYGHDGVSFVGVTSLQKSQAEGGDGEVGAATDAERVRIIREFMAEHGMTWPVVFIPGSVFNPSYGVNGIPHIAVIGADGVVLGNDVPLEELAGMIERATR